MYQQLYKLLSVPMAKVCVTVQLIWKLLPVNKEAMVVYSVC